MIAITKRLHTARSIAADTSGVALIEFAFVAPLMAFMLISAVELAYLGQIHMRVSEMANTVTDNASRVTSGMDESNIREVFTGANILGAPIDFRENGRIVLSSLQENEMRGNAAGQVIDWQRCWGELDVDPNYGIEGAGRNDNSMEDGMGGDDHQVISIGRNAIIFAEVSYRYEPLFLNSLVDEQTIRYESAFSVRDQSNRHITNALNLGVMTCD